MSAKLNILYGTCSIIPIFFKEMIYSGLICSFLDQPTIEDIPLQIVNETDIVTLTREISANPLANVSWYYGSNLLTTQNSVNTTTYDLGRASCTDTKNFTIIAGNGILNKTAAMVELIVNCK